MRSSGIAGEMGIVGDTVETTQLHNQCVGIGQDVSTQLRSEVAIPMPN